MTIPRLDEGNWQRIDIQTNSRLLTNVDLEAKQEKNNIKVLYPGCMGATGITARIPVKSPADLKDKKSKGMK